jgi:hypothetical protein
LIARKAREALVARERREACAVGEEVRRKRPKSGRGARVLSEESGSMEPRDMSLNERCLTV